MHLVQVPAAECDLLRTFVFSSNLAAQELTGDAAASVDIERVITRLKGSDESRAVLLAALEAPSLGDLGELGLPVVRGEADALGFVWLTLPLLEDTDTLELDVVLAPDLLPLPGEELEPEAREVTEALIDASLHAAPLFGRVRLQWWTDRAPGGEWEEQVTVAQYVVDLSAVQLGAATEHSVLRDLDCGEHTHDVCRLLSIFSEDEDTGKLVTEPIRWDAERLRGARERLLDRRDRDLIVLLRDSAGRALALAQATHHEGTTVAELGAVVVERDQRGHGHGRQALDALLHSMHLHWPHIEHLYAAVNAQDAAALAQLNALHAREITRLTCFEHRGYTPANE
ncbi:GNAT family N-acetyltransferase [Corynebacterium tapiri]|uniref:N-acetyltransferase domain-containing protein n=1 Tax=Corynebacterium tapiri TaxID=1448266 RepID=A0A5C4U4Y7_9CORY|nr:GNAT family N-acetyltransferase [Corynebacterium tapiri]TNL99229.1 hypothetical protein FHE74_02410 [Corynebacterium tapiri]